MTPWLNVKVIKTAAETALAHAVYARAGAASGRRGAIATQRAAAFDVFVREGLPHRRIEEWKYTDLRALMRDAKPLAARLTPRRRRAPNPPVP